MMTTRMCAALKTQSRRALAASKRRTSYCVNAAHSQLNHSDSKGHSRSFSSSIQAGLRVLNVGARTLSSMDDLMELHSKKKFLRELPDEQVVSLFVITRFPETADPIDLKMFLQGAKQVIEIVLTNIYSTETQELESSDTNELLNTMATRPSVHNFISKVPDIKKLGHLKGADVRLELEKLDIKKIQFASAQFELIELEEEEKMQEGSDREEWLQIEVAYEVVEHLRFIATSGLEDRMIFNTKFKCTFESNVSKGLDLDWRICQVSKFDQNPAILTATAKPKMKATTKKEEEEKQE